MKNTDYIYLQSVCTLDINARQETFEKGSFLIEPEEEEKVNIILKTCKETETGVLTLRDSGYPEMLKDIYAAPFALYTKGTIPSNRFVAVSGTRIPGPCGRRAAESIGAVAAALGISVLTLRHGGADSAASSETLKKGGSACTVLDRGFSGSCAKNLRRFPDRYGEVSEYCPGMDCSGVNTRHAYRIAAGMCPAVVMIDMPEKGILRCFAEEALEQGKEVLLLQNGKKKVEGSHAKRLVSEGAYWFNSADQLAEKLKELY